MLRLRTACGRRWRRCGGSARPEDGYNSGGYEWCIAKWGTKWPACDVEVEEPVPRYGGKTWEVVLHFKTAWSPPTPVIAKAAERYPALRLELRYFECGCCFNVAELGAAFLSATCGLDNSSRLDDASAYLAGWLKALRDDKKLLLQAASAAQKGADYILGKTEDAAKEGRTAA